MRDIDKTILQCNNIPVFIEQTSWDNFESMPEYVLAVELCEAIQQGYADYSSGRWASWWDQIARSSQSTVHNFAEAMGRGRGNTLASLMIARGELYECVASLHIGPKTLCDPLKGKAKELIALFNQRVKLVDSPWTPS